MNCSVYGFRRARRYGRAEPGRRVDMYLVVRSLIKSGKGIGKGTYSSARHSINIFLSSSFPLSFSDRDSKTALTPTITPCTPYIPEGHSFALQAPIAEGKVTRHDDPNFKMETLYYLNNASFTRAFSRRYGVSPSQLRHGAIAA